jgi:predicted  nucleic acid-binding Zn-ribbon protein
MKRSRIPEPILDRLDALEPVVEDLTERLARTADAISAARARLDGSFESQEDYDDTMAALRQLIADQPVLQKKLAAARRDQQVCKEWLTGLADDVNLELVELASDDRDLEALRARLKAAEDELAALRAVPEPSPDIERRIKAYVRDMARPEITGIGSGERLRVIWPGAGWDSAGPREHRAELLPLIAMLHPEAMVAALMREVERNANALGSPAERRGRSAQLEAEIDDLQRRALALGAELNALPPAVLLGARVAKERVARRARVA